MGFVKNIFDKSRYGTVFNRTIGGNELNNEWADIMINDPENLDKVYKNGKAVEKNYFPNGLDNSPLEKPDGYDKQEDAAPEPASDGSSMIAPKNKYMDMFNQNHRSELDVLLKPLQKTGEDEINAARKFAMFENKDAALGKRMNEQISSWYDNMYGTTPLKRDASGRQIEPTAKTQAQSSHPTTKDGLDMTQGLTRLSQQMQAIDEDDTPEKGVSALQKNLNALGTNPQLKVDNELGPKTSLQTRQYLAENGYDKLSGAFKKRLYAGS